MLTEDHDSPTFKRIFAEFNTSLFGTAPPRSDNLIADDGDYESELKQFRNELRADPFTEGVVDVGAKKTTPPCSLPVSPIQTDHHVSISVTSHVSHTITTSSQVSTVINSSIALLPECEVSEVPPSPPKVVRPVPKKNGSRPSKPTMETTTTMTSDANTDTASLQKKSSRKAGKTTTMKLPTRVLRDRT